jgi:hypothetical protein
MRAVPCSTRVNATNEFPVPGDGNDAALQMKGMYFDGHQRQHAWLYREASLCETDEPYGMATILDRCGDAAQLTRSELLARSDQSGCPARVAKVHVCTSV